MVLHSPLVSVSALLCLPSSIDFLPLRRPLGPSTTIATSSVPQQMTSSTYFLPSNGPLSVFGVLAAA